MEQITSMIEQHPYVALAVGLVVGYGVITLTTTTKQEIVAQTTTPDAEQQQTAATSTTSEGFYGTALPANPFPETNPLANLNITERTGIMNPVLYNKSYDVRGEPQGVRNQDVVEAAWMKNPRGAESALDERQIKGMRRSVLVPSVTRA